MADSSVTKLTIEGLQANLRSGDGGAARMLLEENEQLTARVAELQARLNAALLVAEQIPFSHDIVDIIWVISNECLRNRAALRAVEAVADELSNQYTADKIRAAIASTSSSRLVTVSTPLSMGGWPSSNCLCPGPYTKNLDCPVHGSPSPPALPAEPQPYIEKRDPGCVKQWPQCQDGDYNPACCRFPKSCSCARPEWLEIDRMKSGQPPIMTEGDYRVDHYSGAGQLWSILHMAEGWIVSGPTKAEAWQKMGAIMEKRQIIALQSEAVTPDG
jgi:hypothetical protein